ncbi:hypothetical protein PYCC9005_001018 [Savitreella phatthalungensis]
MRALVTIQGKTAEVQEVEQPKPEEGEILIKVHYVAQNPTDWKAMRAVPPGRIIGCDFAGTVHDSNGSHWREGQRVAGFVQGTAVKPTRGVFAEFAVVEASLVYPIPDGISFQQATVIPLAFATAVQALFQRLSLPEPSKPATTPIPIVINGGSSSVGKYAIQLSKLAGLFVIATGSKRNHQLLLDLGADAVVDYNDQDWVDQIRNVSHDNLQHAFDTISENGTTVAISRAMSPTKGGLIVTLLPTDKSEISNSKVKAESTIVYTVFERELHYGAFDNCGGRTPEDKALWEKYLSMLPDLLTQGKIKPNRVKELGGLDNILEGFQLQMDGKVSAEKLVYKIADA